MPAYFPDDFATFEGGHDPIVIAWLVPISRAEASFVAQRGWGAFEDVLVEQNPDLTDFYRGSTKL